MYMAASIRFFCVVGPMGDKEADISFKYLKALSETELGVRAIALGPMELGVIVPRGVLASLVGPHFAAHLPADGDDPNARWRYLTDVFANPIDAKYVNVVRCPPGSIYGSRRTARELGMSTSDEVVTRPGYTLCELLTSNVPNVAITGFSPPPTEAECKALRNYDMVVCHDVEDVVRFAGVDIPALYLPEIEALSNFLREELVSRDSGLS